MIFRSFPRLSNQPADDAIPGGGEYEKSKGHIRNVYERGTLTCCETIVHFRREN